jgi:hypothetical protein
MNPSTNILQRAQKTFVFSDSAIQYGVHPDRASRLVLLALESLMQPFRTASSHQVHTRQKPRVGQEVSTTRLLYSDDSPVYIPKV